MKYPGLSFYFVGFSRFLGTVFSCLFLFVNSAFGSTGSWLGLHINITAPSVICSVSVAQNILFGSFSSSIQSELSASGDVIVNCTQGVSSAISVGNGLNYDNGSRKMSKGSDFIPYNITQPSGVNFDTCSSGNTVWQSASPLDIASLFASFEGAKQIKICGYIPVAPPSGYANGNYSDTIVITVSY